MKPQITQSHINVGQIAYANQFQTNNDGEATQHVQQSTAKMAIELLWDGTDSGIDVRVSTDLLLALMAPAGNGRAPATLAFDDVSTVVNSGQIVIDDGRVVINSGNEAGGTSWSAASSDCGCSASSVDCV